MPVREDASQHSKGLSFRFREPWTWYSRCSSTDALSVAAHRSGLVNSWLTGCHVVAEMADLGLFNVSLCFMSSAMLTNRLSVAVVVVLLPRGGGGD